TTQTAHYGQSHPTYAYAPSSGVQNDGSLAQASDYTGTGGGYDPSLDSYLASLREGGNGNALSPQDAVAYNQAAGALNPSSAANLAAVGASGTSGSKALVAILVGLVAAGLAGYAVNAYLAYRRERGL
ncbi:MAG TPA: hypothetical protein VFT82_00720, partial [Candidatus Paceibacterota bacterium]|nr:hypothetical protein [Candidatus Paceibacterota bacterium]